MGSISVPSPLTKEESNLQRLLNSLTPVVPLKPIPEFHLLNDQKYCIEKFNGEWKNSEKPAVKEYFRLRDIWTCFEEWSAYGRGTEVILNNGEKVQHYFTPYVSAVQISINEGIQKVDSTVGNASCNGTTKSLSAESKTNEVLIRSSSNNSGNGKFCDSSSGSYSSTDHERKEIKSLAQENPGLLTLRSTDLLPSSWMAVAWYPICQIPVKGVVKELDFSAAFITFHTLSSFHPDTGVDSNHDENAEIGETKASVNKKRIMPLPPFGLAALNLTGDVWLSNGHSDEERYADLYNAASSWLQEHHFYHHDFNFFANNSHVRGGTFGREI
ncbi:uncharacterized protein LOC108217292 [Daucus carota subsp. sativus]|uniref:uncharacterized protein LOC108217292 n=1 Tax=Daucus carota subsp. sativus TaxID=79200 RepID=UPI0007EF2FD5|nr:PREDICTED: uncharacterized protein LOC108217292 [Daucus carota subsp. sativus]